MGQVVQTVKQVGLYNYCMCFHTLDRPVMQEHASVDPVSIILFTFCNTAEHFLSFDNKKADVLPCLLSSHIPLSACWCPNHSVYQTLARVIPHNKLFLTPPWRIICIPLTLAVTLTMTTKKVRLLQPAD